MSNPVVLDCRKKGRKMSSLSISPVGDGQQAIVSAHEGTKPNVGDYLLFDHPKGGPALYQAYSVDHCYGVDPANMWIANAVFIPGSKAKLNRSLVAIVEYLMAN